MPYLKVINASYDETKRGKGEALKMIILGYLRIVFKGSQKSEFNLVITGMELKFVKRRNQPSMTFLIFKPSKGILPVRRRTSEHNFHNTERSNLKQSYKKK